METATGSIVSADGAIYAIRKVLYRRPASSAITDDFALSTGVVEQGYRLVFESDALAYEEAMPRAKEEFWRKVRIMNRGLRGIILRKRLLNPFQYGFYSVVLFSHKLIRRLVPIFLITLFVSNITLSSTNEFYFLFLIAQVVFYSLASISFFLRNTSVGHLKLFYIPFFYCLANIASLVAIWKLVSGERIELWQPQR
jgi:cellulose synthase/poly-beta-1,6-N-acetylglucosamine synthase-like glycosyltransferase